MKNAIAFMFNWEIFENKKIILLYQTASAVLIGVCGTILVIMLLATILPLSKAVNFIPWLIGFNTAMTGYSLVEKTRDSLKYRHIVSIGAGYFKRLNYRRDTERIIRLYLWGQPVRPGGPADIVYHRSCLQ